MFTPRLAFFSDFRRSEKQHLKIPRDIQDAKMLAKVLDRYKDMYYFEVMFGVVVAYVLYPFIKWKYPYQKSRIKARGIKVQKITD